MIVNVALCLQIVINNVEDKQDVKCSMQTKKISKLLNYERRKLIFVLNAGIILLSFCLN